MRKFITALLFILAVNLNAQVVIKLNSFYMFKHDVKYTTFDALNNNLDTKRGSGFADVILTFDTTSMTASQFNKIDSTTLTFKITDIVYLSNDATTYMVKDSQNYLYSYTYFQNTPNEKQVICIWRKGLFEFYGWQSVIK